MFRVMLYTQWKWSRLIILLGSIAAFALPIISLQGAARGLVAAVAGGARDQRGRQAPALTLPLPRGRCVLLRGGGGAALLAIPVAAVFAGATLATATATLPPGLQRYPLALGTHFALATAVAYAGFFAVSAGTARTAGIILGVCGAAVGGQLGAGVSNLDRDILVPLRRAVL